MCYIYLHNDRNQLDREPTMYTTSDEKGILNNFATEPQLSYATPPSPSQQRAYFFQGAMAAVLVTATVLVSLAVS